MFAIFAHIALWGLMFAAIAYTLAAAWLVGRLGPAAPPAGEAPGVTVLKPLHGLEPRLRENLLTFVRQDYSGEAQLLCGVADPLDPAGLVARDVGAELVAGAQRAGSNGKISNVLSMMSQVRHEIIVLSDSDMSVPPDYLATIVTALGGEGVGAVTCLYRGHGDAGAWSRLAAAGLSYHFLPSVVLGLALGRAKPCMGSTIALRRATLDAIGGFTKFSDVLADDYEIGRAVRALGLTVAVPPLILTHGCADRGFRALAAHELRWAAAVRLVDPVGYAGMVVTHPVPLALLAACALGGGAWWLVAAALAARVLLAWRLDRIVGEASAPLWMLPVRDLLSGALFVAGLFVRRVEWRGERLDLAPDGRMALDR